MRDYPLGAACEPERLAQTLLKAIAASYALDGVLLAAFAWAGVIGAWVPVTYVVVGLACCVAFHAALTSGFAARCADRSLALPQLAVAACVQVCFIVLAPAVALYFVGVLFIVFAFAALRLRLRDAVLAWAGVSVAVTVAIALLPEALDIPHESLLERILVCASILLALARCTLLGVYGHRLRLRLGDQYAAARRFLETSDRRAASVARDLHEDLGQDLAGIALALAAHATRLQRDGGRNAEGLADAVLNLRATIEKTRALAEVLGANADDAAHADACTRRDDAAATRLPATGPLPRA